MDTYQDLAAEIARLHSAGEGSPDVRSATAALVYALFIYEFTQVRLQLRRTGVDDVDVHESSVYVRLRVQGRILQVTRLPAQSELRVEVFGLPYPATDTRPNVPVMSPAEAQRHVTKAVRAFLAVVREDMAKQGA